MNADIFKKLQAVVLMFVFIFSTNIFHQQTIFTDSSANGLARLISNLQTIDGHTHLMGSEDFTSTFRKILGSMRSIAGVDAMIILFEHETDQAQDAAIILIAKSPTFFASKTDIYIPVLDSKLKYSYSTIYYISPTIIPELPPPMLA